MNISSLKMHVLVQSRRKSLRRARRRFLFESLEIRRVLHAPGAPVLALETEHGVIESGGLVSQWDDYSGNGNHVFTSGTAQPTIGAVTTPSGAEAIRFDGLDDRLIRTIGDGLTGLPTGNANRSLFLVAQFHDAAAWGGASYGAGAANQQFGAGVVAAGESEGNYFLGGWGKGNDLISTQSGYTPPDGPTTGWTILAAVLADGQATLFANGAQIATWAHTYNTNLTNATLLNGSSTSRFVLGEEIKELGHIEMDVAAVLVYNEAASDTIRNGIESYLYSEYLAVGTTLNAINDSLETTQDNAAAIPTSALLANDALGTQPTTITAISTATTQGGTVVFNSENDSYIYSPPNGFIGTDSFTYTITDSTATSDTATVSVTVTAAFEDELVVDGLSAPLDIQTLPDGRMLLLEKGGTMKIFNPADPVPQALPYLTIPEVQSTQERGLTAIALDPEFETNGYFYVYYSRGEEFSETENKYLRARLRVSRFTHIDVAGVASAPVESEVVIWQDPASVGTTAFCCHYGGGLDFGPDEKLYLTIGDKWKDPNTSQDLTNTGGKILRFNKDGTIPEDNPVFADPNALPEIWALGLRNPFRAKWDLPTNRFFIGDVGGNVQSEAQEEINLGVAGANYGWPGDEGITGDPLLEDPIYSYGHTAETPNGGAISGGLVYRGGQYPQDVEGAYIFGDYVAGWIHYITFDQNGDVVGEFELVDTPIAPVAFELGSDGLLYYADYYTNQIRRIAYNSGNQSPVIVSASATPTSGSIAPLTVEFAGTAEDFENQPLTYVWDFGDGTQGAGPEVSHVYQNLGQYAARLQVSDGERTSVSDPIVITVGQAPVIESISPADGSLFRAGTDVTLSAVVTDNDPIVDSSYSWSVRFIHNAHTHPVFSNVSGATVVLDIPTTGHDFSDSTGFEIELSVTDATGIRTTEIVRIYPEKVNLGINSTFPGEVTYILDGVPRTGDFVLDTAISFQHTISVPEILFSGGYQYSFLKWSNDSTNPELTFTVPDVDSGLTAEYKIDGSATLVTENLVMQLNAEAGVSTSTGTTVSGWVDQSGLGNDLTAVGNPQRVLDALNGRDVIQFDGVDDRLVGVAAAGGNLPGGANDRSVFVVAKYDGVGWGGFTYGAATSNQTFGPAVNRTGQLSAQGWGNTNDLATTVAGTGAGWLIQELVLTSNQLRHYKNGTLIDTRDHTYNTLVGPDSVISLGAEIDGTPFVNMSIAEVLVYDRALTTLERQQVENYLEYKFFAADQSPIAANDTYITVPGTPLQISYASLLQNDVLANQPTTVTSFSANSTAGGTIAITQSALLTYTPPIGFVGSDTFTYTITDFDGDTSLATVTVGVQDDAIAPTSPVALFDGKSLTGLYPWLKEIGATDPNQVFTVQDGLLRVSGNGMGSLTTTQRYRDYAMVLEFKWGDETFAPRIGKAKDAGVLIHSNGPDGGWRGALKPGIQSQIMEGGMGDIILLEELIPMSVTVERDQLTCTFNTWNCRGGYRWNTNGTSQVFNQDVDSVHSLSWDPDWQDIQGFRGDIDYESADGEWNQMVIVASGDSFDIYINGILVNQATGVTPTSGQLQLEAEYAEYFVRRWDLLPLGSDTGPSISTIDLVDTTVGQPYSDSVDATSLNLPLTFSIASGSLPAGLNLNTSTGQITGIATTAGLSSFLIQVTDASGKFATASYSISVASLPAPGLITRDLVLRLDADSGVTLSTGTTVSGWNDQSGRANHLTASGNPQVIAAELNGHNVIRFDGNGDSAQRTATLNGLPGGSGNRSVFVVAKYDGVGYGGFAYGRPASNQTFGASVTPTGTLMAQAWGATYDLQSTATGTGAGWLIQEIVLDSNQVTHYKNGVVIGTRSQAYNTAIGTGSLIMLGAEIDNSPNVDMSVAEILVYNRAVTTTERQQIEAYLQAKYFTVNRNPVAVNDSSTGFTTASNGSFTTGNVLSNDTDPDVGDVLSVQSFDTSGTLGVVTNVGNGTFSYDPNGQFSTLAAGQTATDTFTYVVSDGNGGSDTATVTITIQGESANADPVANDDGGSDFTTTASSSFTTGSVLSNDTDPDVGDVLSVQSFDTSGTLGIVTNVGDGTFSYDPNGQFSTLTASQTATDTFTYVVSDGNGGSDTATVTITVQGEGVVVSAGPQLRTGVLNVSTSGWTTVTLDESYNDMVVVATLATSKDNPAVVTRIRNAGSGNTFEITLQHAGTLGGTGTVTVPVHYMVVEKGAYTVAEHGVKLDAVKMTSTVTDYRGSYVGQNALGLLSNSYTSPVVVGQLMSTAEGSGWSAFWSRGASATDPASGTALWVGKHVGSDGVTSRSDETLGFIVVEQGGGTIDGLDYRAVLGPSKIDGVHGSGSNYDLSSGANPLSFPSTGIASLSGMHGPDGGWAVLHGANPLTDLIYLAIDEDQVMDFERSHANEQVAYIVFKDSSAPVLTSLAATTHVYDADADGFITPLDALRVINAIRSPSGDGEAASERTYNTDVNGDGLTTPLDALLVINYLSRQHRALSRQQATDFALMSSDDDEDRGLLESAIDSVAEAQVSTLGPLQ